MSTEHTLRIRCPTWDHLENFYDAKVKDGNVLLARVPFSPTVGASITIALELPDGLVVTIDAQIEGVRQAPDGKKSAVRMALGGMEQMRPRLARAVEMGRRDLAPATSRTRAEPGTPRTRTGLLVPIPSDVPIDEPVEVVRLPKVDEVAAEVRPRYEALQKALAAMREKAAHDVLGVEWDAEVADIRVAYFGMVKQYHPDVLSKFGSDAVSLLGSEIFIYINKAYDRLRDSAVAAGKAIAAGPALLPSSGWIADFDDIGVARSRTSHSVSDLATPVPVPVKVMSSLAAKSPAAQADLEVHFSPATTPGELDRADREAAETPAASPMSAHDRDALFADARSSQSGMQPLDGKRSESSSEFDDEEEDAVDVPLLVERARALLDENTYDEARDCLAQVLEVAPRNREARALYHVAYGHTLAERDNPAAARTQFEVALKHDPECQAAIDAMDKKYSGGRRRRQSLLQRLFRR